MKQHKSPNRCEMCKRRVPLTFHHLIPRKLHRRTHFKKHYSKAELQAGIYICRPCHSGIHKLFSEMTLGKELNTLEQLMSHPQAMRHATWVAKQHQAPAE